MAIAGSQVANYGRMPLGNGKWMFWGTVTGPTSYTSGGEAITKAVASSLWGVRDIQGISCSPAAGSSWGTGCVVNFEPTPTDTTNAGKFHFFNSGSDAHTHDLLIKGGQTAQTHTHNMKIIGGQAAAATDTVFVPAATDLLGKQEAGDADVLGADVLTKGGVMLGSTSTAISMISTDTLGKEQATDRTILGADAATKGGVVATAADVPSTEVAAATNFSTFTFFIQGIGAG